MRLKLVKDNTSFDFFSRPKLWLGISAALALAALVSFLLQGLFIASRLSQQRVADAAGAGRSPNVWVEVTVLALLLAFLWGLDVLAGRGTHTFRLGALVGLILLFIFPQLVLWLPKIMSGG